MFWRKIFEEKKLSRLSVVDALSLVNALFVLGRFAGVVAEIWEEVSSRFCFGIKENTIVQYTNTNTKYCLCWADSLEWSLRFEKKLAVIFALELNKIQLYNIQMQIQNNACAEWSLRFERKYTVGCHRRVADLQRWILSTTKKLTTSIHWIICRQERNTCKQGYNSAGGPLIPSYGSQTRFAKSSEIIIDHTKSLLL